MSCNIVCFQEYVLIAMTTNMVINMIAIKVLLQLLFLSIYLSNMWNRVTGAW